MKRACQAIAALLVVCFFLAGCSEKEVPQTVKEYPLDSMAGVLTQTNVVFDPDISTDNRGSLRIDAPAPMTVYLYEVKNINVDRARLTYQGRLKTKDVQGKVYLEMMCVFSGKGEYFSSAASIPAPAAQD